ncbi:Sensor kinase CckA [subsurface metagenome]
MKNNLVGGHETILLVDDEEVVRNMIATTLKTFGYTVLQAESGEEALQIYEQSSEKPIHLMITDVVMPGMSGYELVKQLSKKIPDIKVLYISGYTDNTIVHHGMLNKGLHFLQKPFTPNVLAEKVREVLDS